MELELAAVAFTIKVAAENEKAKRAGGSWRWNSDIIISGDRYDYLTRL
ncbi:MAG: hypothetical protein QXM44_06690 [Candidatus Bathyarchaeia archaeon]